MQGTEATPAGPRAQRVPFVRRALHSAGREIRNSVLNILALASITYKDALRKKALFTIGLFAVLMFASGFFAWVRPEYRLQQMTRICLGGIGFFGMVLAIFLAAPNLPDDISRKTIFTVMTKPARRWHILAGKILGLAYVLAIVLVVMGAMSYAYISFWSWKMGPHESGLPLLQGHKRTHAASVEYLGKALEVSEPMLESQRAIASGFERVKFNFTGLDKEHFKGEKVFAELTLFSHGYSVDPLTDQGTGLMQAQNPTTGETASEIFGAMALQPLFVGFPGHMIDDQGAVSITLITRLESGNYSAMAASVAVLSQPSGYFLNFLKALLLMFMQYMLLVFIATAASTFLTSTVSVITALFVYFTGSLTEIVREQALKLGTETNIFAMAVHAHEEASGGAGGATEVAVSFLMRYFYLGVSIAFPNLQAYDPAPAVASSEYISPATLWTGLAYGSVYAVFAFLVAWAVFRRKEVA
ncbi:MAG: ABC transporter permease [Planctomycetota bacterium]|jgi:ABC-type transport system involved in multi-copper enzyme maturation permease subunit